MQKSYIFIILLSLVLISGISGCTEKKAVNGTWGEKEPVSAKYIKIINSTGEHYLRNGTNYYYVYGYVENTAEDDAYNVEIHAKFFDEKGNVVGTNNSARIKPKIIPALGQSWYVLRFNDPENKIVRFELEIVVKK